MAGGRGVPPAARRTYLPGTGGTNEIKLGAAVYRSPLLKFRRTPTQAQIYSQQTLAVAAQFTREITTWEKENCTAIAGRSGWTWRDQFYGSLFGTALEFTDVNGVSWFSRRVLAMNIQQLLDSISSMPGSVLVRTPTGWAALYPGSHNDVLTINPSTGVPDWLAAAGGGGPADLQANFIATGTAGDSYASLGYFFTFPLALTITTIAAMLSPGAIGRTYDIYCAPYNPSTNKITAAPTKAGTFTSTSTGGPQPAAFDLPAPITVAIGDTWAFWVSQTFGSATTTPDTYYSSGNRVTAFYFSIPSTTGIKLAKNAPAMTDTWTTQAVTWAMSFLYHL